MKNRFPKLDTKCVKIFAVLGSRGELRFSDLKRILPTYGINIHESTLVIHLNHLIKRKLVEKKIYSVKNVTYKPNVKELEKFQSFVDSVTETTETLERMKKTLLEKPVRDQITFLMRFEVSMNLNALKSKILFQKYGRFEDAFKARSYESHVWGTLENLMIAKCLEDDEYRENILAEIDDLLKEFWE